MAVVTKRATPVPLGKAKTKIKPKTIVPTTAPFPPQQTDEFSQYRTPSGKPYHLKLAIKFIIQSDHLSFKVNITVDPATSLSTLLVNFSSIK